MDTHSPLDAFSLRDRTVIVTGASSGLGRRFAEVVAGAGGKVVLAARRAKRIDALAATLPGALPVACDVTDPAERAALIEAAVDFGDGKLHGLVNNAGTTRIGPALEESDEDFAGIVELNLVAPFALARDAARHMIDAGVAGSIVNVGSILGVVGVGQVPQAGYAAAKGGLLNLTRELAAQWGRQGVRVNALAPGWFRSEMTDEMFDDERSMDWVRRKTVLGRGGEPPELDGALLFLLSDASSYVTGQVLAVDGGWTAL